MAVSQILILIQISLSYSLSNTAPQFLCFLRNLSPLLIHMSLFSNGLFLVFVVCFYALNQM